MKVKHSCHLSNELTGRPIRRGLFSLRRSGPWHVATNCDASSSSMRWNIPNSGAPIYLTARLSPQRFELLEAAFLAAIPEQPLGRDHVTLQTVRGRQQRIFGASTEGQHLVCSGRSAASAAPYAGSGGLHNRSCGRCVSSRLNVAFWPSRDVRVMSGPIAL